MPKSKSMCTGCEDDFYNRNREGGCWSYSSAKIVQRVKVGTWEPPPYARERALPVLACYRQKGAAFLEVTDCRVKPQEQIDDEQGE